MPMPTEYWQACPGQTSATYLRQGSAVAGMFPATRRALAPASPLTASPSPRDLWRAAARARQPALRRHGDNIVRVPAALAGLVRALDVPAGGGLRSGIAGVLREVEEVDLEGHAEERGAAAVRPGVPEGLVARAIRVREELLVDRPVWHARVHLVAQADAQLARGHPRGEAGVRHCAGCVVVVLLDRHDEVRAVQVQGAGVLRGVVQDDLHVHARGQLGAPAVRPGVPAGAPARAVRVEVELLVDGAVRVAGEHLAAQADAQVSRALRRAEAFTFHGACCVRVRHVGREDGVRHGVCGPVLREGGRNPPEYPGHLDHDASTAGEGAEAGRGGHRGRLW
eukprot:CAMPEP_0179259856 /NCGR_PEP_ID=MMETSP0797-20121207/26037_1 /TAXON_ID=47934 /ORGANISM="Dinophysis acuminata, Strain DAEP01" /LENGTH=337 /DNA_ID=CAMNT_0020967913 /DNA_START=1 /DNA_END=1012 /DNA_ORIENTATION=+